MGGGAGELFVVPGEKHVERLAREGHRAETRAALRSRLAVALLPNVAFADARESRLVLGMALDDLVRNQKNACQLDLFLRKEGDGDAPGGSRALLAAHARGGASWTGMMTALDDAITTLRARAVTAAMLERVTSRTNGVASERARTLATAMTALDARLRSFGTHDERLTGAMLAEVMRASDARDLVSILGARHLVARWLLAWEPSDLLWWRALDDKLSARIVLPAFEHRLEAAREPDPLEVLTEDVARLLDAPPEGETIAPVLGDLSMSSVLAPDPSRVSLLQVADYAMQADEAVSIVGDALGGGAALERVVIALPIVDERSLGPLRRALHEASIASFDARGTSPSQAPVVACAFAVLDAAETLSRQEVARLLRSGYVDGPRLGPQGARAHDVGRALVRIAQRLETHATAAGDDPRARLVRTASGQDGRSSDEEDALDEAISTRLAEVLEAPRRGTTRIDRMGLARAAWNALGLGARAERGGLSTFRKDDAPTGVARAERDAIARDARAWDALVSAMDLYERVAHRAGALDEPIDLDTFRAEIALLLDASAPPPSAGRAGAVRVLRLEEVVGEALDLLVIVDANEGLLPRDEPRDALVSDALLAALSQVRPARGEVAPKQGVRRARELSALAAAASDAARIVMISVREDDAGAPLLPSQVVTLLERAGLAVASARREFGGATVTRDLALRVRREREREAFFLDPLRPRSDVVGELNATPELRTVLAGATGGGPRALAVTSLERFARCPFQGYAHAVILAREAQVHDELPDAREEGTLVHDALAAAFTATRDGWPERPRDGGAIVDAGLRAADEILDRWQGHAPLRAVVRMRVRDCVRAVLASALSDEAWDFMLAEKSFGGRGEDDWPALVIEGERDLVVLRGTIDRVDRGRGGVRVVDYKRSKSTVRETSKALGVTALQVPLYACVAAKMLGGQGTGTYVPFLPRDVLNAEANEQIETAVRDLAARPQNANISPIEHRALSLMTRVRAGGLTPIPAGESECRFCAVSGACRKPRFAMAPVDEAEET